MRQHAALVLLALSACTANVSPTAGAEPALCADAVAHVEACVGEAPVVDVCDAASAEQLLAMSCEDLGEAKADNIASDTLCFFGFESFCGSAEPVRAPWHTLAGTVQRDDTLATVSGILIHVTDGYVHESRVTGPDGVFRVDLQSGRYHIAAYDGAVLLHERTIEVDGHMAIVVIVPPASR